MRACRAIFVGVFLDGATLLGDLFNFNSGLALPPCRGETPGGAPGSGKRDLRLFRSGLLNRFNRGILHYASRQRKQVFSCGGGGRAHLPFRTVMPFRQHEKFLRNVHGLCVL
jgi:hypothetical protein